MLIRCVMSQENHQVGNQPPISIMKYFLIESNALTFTFINSCKHRGKIVFFFYGGKPEKLDLPSLREAN